MASAIPLSIEPTYSFGIEEEYYLVDRQTRALAKDPPRRLLSALKRRLGKQFSEEYMRSQIEICTPVCHDAAEGRAFLIDYRRAIGEEAAKFGLAPIAAATHPFSRWRGQRHRDKPRYNDIAEDFKRWAGACWCAGSTSISASKTRICASW